MGHRIALLCVLLARAALGGETVGPEVRLGPLAAGEIDRMGVPAEEIAREADARAVEERLGAIVDTTRVVEVARAAFEDAFCGGPCAAPPTADLALLRYGIVVQREGDEPTWRFVGRVTAGRRVRTMPCHVHLDDGPSARVLHATDDASPLRGIQDTEIRAAFDEIARHCGRSWGAKALRLAR